MAKKADESSEMERGYCRPRPGSIVLVVVAPPTNIYAQPRSSSAAGGGGDEDDDDDRKMPKYVWVSVLLLLTAVACCPLMALVLMRTDWVEKIVFSCLLLPTVVGVFFFLRAVCTRPSMSVFANMIKRYPWLARFISI